MLYRYRISGIAYVLSYLNQRQFNISYSSNRKSYDFCGFIVGGEHVEQLFVTDSDNSKTDSYRTKTDSYNIRTDSCDVHFEIKKNVIDDFRNFLYEFKYFNIHVIKINSDINLIRR